ncbi:hypothetical protein UFOVP35_18 [uncultured Caudovirales phage]|uniref:Uncharacterized protein n=1 Tax=uncultured Caudovirales phage TaxID=2100421 RepID=A0A6J5KL29_9CAUD|nr:hypothetical protein UFOVP35_18 [uncultured Caudovirales phage]CAB4124487.1 hypothetical protein UFOVP52_29 [uncultured Caudovirales phage]CAB5219866.1 hypothetical protein UFOVP234_54 [uncultured Caudovirales phage]
MAQTGYTPISTYYTATASAVPVNTNLVNGELAINITDGKLYYKDNSGTVKLLSANVTPVANGGTGATTATAGFNALAPTQSSNSGKYLTTDGTNSSWATVVSGATISNDIATASNLYPIFSNATSGTPTTVYTSNAKYLYKPSTGELQASEMVASNGLFVNATTVSANYTVASGFNAQSVGPITVGSGISVTVTSGQRWIVI